MERIPLSGRYHKAKADLLLMHNGEAIYISVKYGTQVPKVLYKADIVKFPGVECFSYPVSGDTQFEAKKLPKFLTKELEHCPVFFGKRARQPWKVAFNSGSGLLSVLTQAPVSAKIAAKSQPTEVTRDGNRHHGYCRHTLALGV